MMTTSRATGALLAAAMLMGLPLRGGEVVDLSGQWKLKLDRENAGGDAHWFNLGLSGSISLPGTLPSQGIGDPVTLATQWTGGIVDRSCLHGAGIRPLQGAG